MQIYNWYLTPLNFYWAGQSFPLCQEILWPQRGRAFIILSSVYNYSISFGDFVHWNQDPATLSLKSQSNFFDLFKTFSFQNDLNQFPVLPVQVHVFHCTIKNSTPTWSKSFATLWVTLNQNPWQIYYKDSFILPKSKKAFILKPSLRNINLSSSVMLSGSACLSDGFKNPSTLFKARSALLNFLWAWQTKHHWAQAVEI